MRRRSFLLGLAGSALLTAVGPAGGAPAARFYSARADRDGQHHLTAFDGNGRLLFDTPLPGRGHGLAVRPGGAEVVQVARRPGRFLLVVDARTGAIRHRLETRQDRHFYGHAQFSADGRWLYTPENDFGAGRGVIGVRDAAAGYRQVGELPSHGVGPHDLRLLSDGRTLAVANGGIRTHPETPRAQLNLDTMSPSLAYVDRESGELLEEQRLPAAHHQSSIRHLALGADNRIGLVMQHQGPRQERPPLVAIHRRGEPLAVCEPPEAVRKRMRNYCGSVCADPSGRWLAVSSPHGGLVTFWDAEDGTYAGGAELPDGCGIAAGLEPGEFLLSSGLGEVVRHRMGEAVDEPLTALAGLGARWDNHMVRL